MHTPLLDIAPTDLVDIAVVALLLWGLVVWTRRARMALLGLAFLGVFYHLIAQQFKLQLTTWILQGFFAALVVVVVVVFQDDLRRLFEQIATLSLRRKAPRPDPSSLGTLTRGLYQLAAKRRGALVVLPGRELIERHFLQHGVPLDAEISEELLDSLFDPGSAGHDGALVMENNRIKEFGVHLPLSENRDELKGGGTRHAAALGLAERSDALCLVVSEERGTIGIATRGQLEILDNPTESIKPGDLRDKIQDHLERTGTEVKERRVEWRWLGRRLMEGLLSLALALGAWLVFVPVEEAVLQVRVDVENVPEGYALTDISPQEVEVAVAGPRRAMLLASNADFQVVIDADLVRLDRRTFEVAAQSVRHATGLEIKSIKPEKVKLTVQKARGGRR
ncbi:MAG: diadenylate cyclase [Gemmatimonadota bacterium]|nr:diadenylate cyclase [Gemmatimonadota bacterium]